MTNTHGSASQRSQAAPSEVDRRGFLTAGVVGAAAGVVPAAQVHVVAEERAPAPAAARDRSVSSRHLEIVDIQRTTVKVPYREVSGRNMARELPHWRYSEIVEVTLKSGHVGFGETLLFYTWGVTDDEDVARARGRNAAELLWDDSLGAGLQMAVFDAVARAMDAPVHALLGAKQHERTPLSWWNIDTSPEDMALECREAYRLGYRAYKTKGRPWFDLWKQVELASREVPESFKIDMDFNDTLLDAERAIPILKELEAYPQVSIYETPIPQGDIAGNKAIRAGTRVDVAMHYGNPEPLVALKEEVCDGFVVGGGARRLVDRGAVAAMADKPFWLQLVGTGITAAWSLHFGGVLSHATWPAVNCHQLYIESMLTEDIAVTDGVAEVPDRPGLGYELDRDAMARFQVEKPARRPEPPRLIETRWPDGRTLYVANTGDVNFMLTVGQQGRMPYFEKGVVTRLVPDDGTDRWRDLYKRARRSPVMMDR